MKSKTVLVIENDMETARAISKTLESSGYLVFTASRGTVGLTMARKINPLVVFLDIATPDTNGLKICSDLKEIEVMKDVPIILITERAEKYEPRYKASYGIVDFIRKPVDPAVVASKLQSALAVSEEPVVEAVVSEAGEIEVEAEVEEFPAEMFEPADEEEGILEETEVFSPVSEEDEGHIEDVFSIEEEGHKEREEAGPEEMFELPESDEYEEAAKTGGPSPYSEHIEKGQPPKEEKTEFPFEEEEEEEEEEQYASKPAGDFGSDIMQDTVKSRLKKRGRKIGVLYIALFAVVSVALAFAVYGIFRPSGKAKTPPSEETVLIEETMPVLPSVSEAPGPDIEKPAAPPPAAGAPKAEPPKPPSKDVEKAEAPKKEMKPSPAKPSFSVQVGAFGSRENAEKLAGDLKGKGYDAFVKQASIEGKTLYKVLVGRFDSRSNASSQAESIKAKESVPAVVYAGEL